MEVFIYCAEIASVLLRGFLQTCVKAEPLHHPSKKPQRNIQNQTVTKVTSIVFYKYLFYTL